MDALVMVDRIAGAFELVSDCDFKFCAPDVFENEAGPAGNPD